MMNTKPPDIQILDDESSLDRIAVETITTLAQDAVEERGKCHLVLSGGGSPSAVYDLMSQSSYQERFPWAHTHVYWGDERNVPPDDPGSNYGQAQILLLGKVPVQEAHVHRIKGELSSLEAATDYRRQLEDLGIGEMHWPIFDIVLLGIGSDGHTASLFPGTTDPLEEKSAVMAVQADYEDRPANRVTLTPLIFNSARCIIFLVKGSQKAEAVAAMLDGPEDKKRWPIHRIRPASGKVLWLMDKAAAARL